MFSLIRDQEKKRALLPDSSRSFLLFHFLNPNLLILPVFGVSAYQVPGVLILQRYSDARRAFIMFLVNGVMEFILNQY